MKHLFSFDAEFGDGTVITQDRNDPEGDISLTKENGSRFSDVMHKDVEDTKLLLFTIYNDNIKAKVDLRDGAFVVNGATVWVNKPEAPWAKDFRIIYYRTMKKQFSQGGEEIHVECLGYTIGWQYTENGENHKATITL